ncbi:ECF RNA polymerase sigma factor SigE [Aquisphaera giovannonii]|uniref:ECF RNA polymerase sigma factor SigE n=1 Tax=Aquisphaera giovannonii TaxID=406548 RepID=A0A5B9WFK4_9BACT|nr:sigma-70 family RNA polymerase sigma factor [Aquisphaera giovannonii]QEH39049.1 ECF RNA polymerase sigma factor SigE [Aquisphaera giovannonii]
MGNKRRGGAVLERLRLLYNVGSIGELTDGQLLERFATDRGEGAELAFAALVERHEATVWRACLAIARDEHDAEDAFQATFLVLVKKARSLWVRESLGPWLYEVACRTARRARAKAALSRRHEHPAPAAGLGAVEPAGEVPGRDPEEEAAVHEELDRLPEKYRAPIVLCDLGGRTHRDAARCLGWPIGTVKSRQSKGRGMLRDRLTRRGLATAAVAAGASLGRGAAGAVPHHVARDAVRAAMRTSGRLFAGADVSSAVLTLTREGLAAMLWTRIRCVAAVALAIVAASGGAGVYVRGSQEPADRPPTAEKPGAATDRPRRPEDGAARLRLQAQRIATRKAKANYEIARLQLELAEIAVEEYEAVGYPRDLASVEHDIALAKSDVGRYQDRVAWAEGMLKRGYVSKAQKESDDLSLKKSEYGLEQNRAKRRVLVDYTKGKTIRELRSAIEKARVEMLDRESEWEQARAAEVELGRHLDPVAE